MLHSERGFRLAKFRARASQCGSLAHQKRAGMSLVEMAVIMIVMGIITAIMLPLMSNMFLSMSEKKKAKQLAVVLGQARNMAIGHNSELIFEFDLKADASLDDTYEGFLIDRSSGSLKREPKIRQTAIELIGVRSSNGAMIDKGKVAIRFLPSGVAEQTTMIVGDNPSRPEAIVVLDRYLGTARVFEKESEVFDYQNKTLKDDQWSHDQN